MPLYRQVEDQLRAAIVHGSLRPRVRLPAIRALADDLQVGRITVINAYDQLASQGYVVGRIGSGTRVADHLPEDALHARRLRPLPAGSAVPTRPPSLGRHVKPLASRQDSSPVQIDVDFRPGRAGCEFVSTKEWQDAYRKAWRQLTDARPGARPSTGLTSPNGDELLRRAIAEYLVVARGVVCDPGEVVVLASAQAALHIAATCWLGPNRRCVVEDPGDADVRQTIELSNCHVTAVAVDQDGLLVAELPSRADMVVTTPSWQYPLGGTLSMPRRLELLEWASVTGAVVVEDDRGSELRYEGRSLTSIRGLAAGAEVVYVGGLSSVAFPGISLGYAVVPGYATGVFTQLIATLGAAAPPVEQRAIGLFISEGHFERYLRRARLAHAERQGVLLEAVRRELGDWLTVGRAAAGGHLVATLRDESWSAQRLAASARRAGIALTPLAECSSLSPLDDRILLNYAGVAPEAIWRGIRRLRTVLATG